MKVCLFDDNTNVLAAFKSIMSFEREIDVCGTYTDALNIESKLDECNPDVILMDIKMPGINGIEAVRQIRIVKPEVKILMYTDSDNEEILLESILAGASGYLLKASRSQKIIDSIKEVMEYDAALSPQSAKIVLDYLKSLSNHQSIKLKKSDNLTKYGISKREIEVLVKTSEGLTYNETADMLFIDFETVKSHLRNAYDKLNVKNKTQAINKAKAEGLIP